MYVPVSQRSILRSIYEYLESIFHQKTKNKNKKQQHGVEEETQLAVPLLKEDSNEE